jgi:protocatechuate 3,4-dioxygenase, beta subunit
MSSKSFRDNSRRGFIKSISAAAIGFPALSLLSNCSGAGLMSAIANSERSLILASDPPENTSYLFQEAPTNLTNKLVIFPDRRDVARIRISGTVYESDGKTPAANVVIYIYHTDEKGIYSKRGDEPRDSFAWWHGKQRGWLKTNERGEYAIDTIKPAPYPDNSEPAHIHAVVKSPEQKHCYNIEDFVFQDDKLLTAKFWERTEKWWRSIGIFQNPNYGGVKLTKNNAGLQEGVRNITLFPEIDVPKIASGRGILEESPAFDPQHAWGPDKGSHACPMCKYGYQPGVLFWVNSDANPQQVEKWAKWLEDLSVSLGDKNFKAYLIYTNPQKLSREQLETKLAAFGQKLNLKKIAVTYVPSADDKATYTYLNRINPETENTFIVYNNRKVADKFVNFEFNEQNIALLKASVERTGKEKELYATSPNTTAPTPAKWPTI